MPRWKIISGARPFYSFPGREDTAIGWARDLQRGDVQFTVNVVVSHAAQDAAELPQESRDAIRSHGRSVINSLLNEETLPSIVDVTPAGLERDYTLPEPEPEEEAEEETEEPGETEPELETEA